MPNIKEGVNREYWENNIEGFSKFYDSESEENIIAPKYISQLYKRIIFPIEKKYMLDRYEIVCAYIEKNVHQGTTIADVGCGGGIFTEKMVLKNARVFALDYSNSALNLVRNKLVRHKMAGLELIKLDITKQRIPCVNLAIAIGVLTYTNEINAFFGNILPYTDKFLFNYLNAHNPINIFRRLFSIFDVRKLCYHRTADIKMQLHKRGFRINHTIKLATGFVIDCEKDNPQ
jgi:SAM-dependent methyltransferase